MNFLLILLKIYLILGPIYVECNPLLLSDYIKQKRLTEAKALSEVRGLPNAPKIKSYSGFLTVDQKYNSNLFFWFFPSFKTPVRAPIVIWLEGGPGGSSIWSLFMLNGPFKVDKHLNVSLNPYSLTQEFSVLYIDNPVGTGFSFTDFEKGYSTDQNSVADNLYEFLQQFYQIFSEYKDNELYISGESYAGKYVPALGYKLLQMSNESRINFKGIAIGNGWTDPVNQLDGLVCLKSTGLIDEKQQDELKAIEDKIRQFYYSKDFVKSGEYLRILCNHAHYSSSIFQKLFPSDNGGNKTALSTATKATGYKSFQNLLSSNYKWESSYFEKYLEINETRNALHVENVKYWVQNATVYQRMASDIMQTMQPNMTALIPHYKVMLYIGNLDMLIGPAQINQMLENKKWKHYKDFYSAKRVIWKVLKNDTEVAGYAKSFGNFIQVIVRNAGHSVAMDQPRSNLDLMKRFIYNLPFEV